MPALPGDIVELRKVADDPQICVRLDPRLHHGKHAGGDPVQDDAPDPRPVIVCPPGALSGRSPPAGPFGRKSTVRPLCPCALLIASVRRPHGRRVAGKALEKRNDGPAHAPGIDDQNDRCLRPAGQVPGGGLHTGSTRAVKIPHDALDHSHVCVVQTHSPGQDIRCGV